MQQECTIEGSRDSRAAEDWLDQDKKQSVTHSWSNLHEQKYKPNRWNSLRSSPF